MDNVIYSGYISLYGHGITLLFAKTLPWLSLAFDFMTTIQPPFLWGFYREVFYAARQEFNANSLTNNVFFEAEKAKYWTGYTRNHELTHKTAETSEVVFHNNTAA
ncbi:hypothetical protein [Fictibacillus terranigra]|uniref:Uncharacterized protein n=1 Tax=Fictibacillus terranigra TaxID=3058424 RepID=A0ABT8E8Y8_9BACL|nr:hypothetical protein [Fictibacillus sp. CENA-BCM004]MDN4074344.1 hypothetical protein [Fictibacillus sp. CENA-BCM004]